MTLRLPRAAAGAVEEHAAEAYPEESCGLLLGPVGTDFASPGRAAAVDETRRLANAWGEGPRSNRYEVSPAALAAVERELRGTGRGVLGFYHSHPDAPAWPSPFDLARAWPCYSYLIVSVSKDGARGRRSWVRTDDGESFVEEPIELVESGS